jgi:hypothetical protein
MVDLPCSSLSSSLPPPSNQQLVRVEAMCVALVLRNRSRFTLEDDIGMRDMLCDVSSAVTEFMVEVLHSGMMLGFAMLLGLKPCHACNPIPCHSGVPPLALHTINHVKQH